MDRRAARNGLVVVGAWYVSGILAFLIAALLIPVNTGMLFHGAAGTVAMWLWLGFPGSLAAALTVVALLWLMDTEKSLPWAGGLAVLYLCAGVFTAYRHLTRGWHRPPVMPDYIGIATQAVIPPALCLIAGVWWTRHFGPHHEANR